MNAVALLRQQLESVHWLQETVMADVTAEASNFNHMGKAIPVGAAYAHSVIAEDMIVSDMLAKRPSIITPTTKTGLSIPMPKQSEWDKHEAWYKTVVVDIPVLREFAKQVYKATDNYLATLKDEDLDVEMDLPGVGKHNLGWLISNFVILHIANLTGEMSAGKGVQGLKGYPF